jgi:putative DNA primase/helicase
MDNLKRETPAAGQHTGEAFDTTPLDDNTDIPTTCSEAALYWFKFGYKVVPIDANAKSTAVRWQPWLDKLNSESIADHWSRHPDHNVGAIIDLEFYILDADSPESRAALLTLEQSFDLEPNLIVKTRKGEHHHFRKAPDTYAVMQSFSTNDEPNKIDVRTGRTKTEGRSIIVLPPSTGKEVEILEAGSASELIQVDQAFVDAVARHNGKEPPRQIEPQQRNDTAGAAGVTQAAEILSYITPNLNYGDWLNVLTGLHDEFSGSEQGLMLADQWSSSSDNYCGFEELEYKWRSFTAGKGITFASVAKMAADAGADLSAIARQCDEHGNKRKTYDELLFDAGAMDQDTVPADIKKLVLQTAVMGTLEREKILKRLKTATCMNVGDLRQLVTTEKRDKKRQSIDARSSNYAPMPQDQFPDIVFNEETGCSKVPATIANIEAMLKNYKISASYDVISKKTQVIVPGMTGSPDNADNSALTRLISLAKLNDMQSEMVPAYVETIADECQVNPVADWIYSREWDGVDRLPAMFRSLEVAGDYPEELRDVLVRRWLVSAVAAALKPIGFRARGVLTLQGPQSIGKTAWLQSLVPDLHLRERLVKTDHMLDPSNKDSILGAITHWLVELGELDSSFKKDIARMKGFITADKDKVRRPYARLEAEYQRRTVFFASVNNSQFLVDETGNTRFWTIAVKRINYNHLLDMQQVWAQMARLFDTGEQWWLTQDEEAQVEHVNKGHRAASSVRELIMTKLNFSALPAAHTKMTATEVLVRVGFDKLPSNAQSREAGAVLRELFGEPAMSNGLGRWNVPPIGCIGDSGFEPTEEWQAV